ncbi:MarR family winged helix-turn-helix transcriptional regulator [Levilactobacillus andaensis]|uniref:MarR family winged helix-turn-helix transcriptional regulator n=1 Tax=Levilactobacillus andaensis TaxID=2799570 RepID=UPI0019433D5E|nr:MarR family transcriptional regulator [Levilactobacillus andaensis]
MEPDDMTLTNQLCFSVYHASRLFTKFYKQALEPFQLTYPQYLVLLSLWEEDRQPLHKLGERLDFGSNTLTPLLKRMEANGWLTRSLPATDHRQLIVSLTEQARDAKPEIFTAIHQCVVQQNIDVSKYNDTLAMNHELIATLQRMLK